MYSGGDSSALQIAEEVPEDDTMVAVVPEDDTMIDAELDEDLEDTECANPAIK